MSGRATFSPLTILSAIKAHQDGQSASAVGKAYRVSPSTILRWKQKWGHEAKDAPVALPNLASVVTGTPLPK